MATATSPTPVTTPAVAGGSRTFDATLASARSTIALRETIHLAVDSFKASKVRFLLTMLGMVIGSASIVLVATLGLTGKQYALEQLSSIGPNKIEMQFSGGNVVGPDNVSTPDNMTKDDLEVVLQQVPNIVASSPMLEDHASIGMGGGLTKDTMLLGVSPQYKEVRNLRTVAGRFFDDQDAASHAKVVVLVKPLAVDLYGGAAAAVGKTISIRSIPFTVIGVFEESFNTQGLSEISSQTVLMPYPVARYFTGTDKVKEIFFTMKNSDDVVPASKQILQIIKDRHRPSSVYNAFIMSDILSLMARIADMLTLVLGLAALVTLTVSGVGIMNSMLANVQARTREIGIRKALGATQREIRLQFLTESVFLSLSGGLVGTLIGIAIPITVSFLTPYKIPWRYSSAFIALFTSVIVGVIFGTLPANRAARLDPVETLKYE